MSDSSLLADLLGLPKQEKNLCKLQKIIDQMTPDEQEAMNRAVELIREDHGNGHGRVYTTTWLSKILRKNNINVSLSVIQRHVNKECGCV
jgi:hypothetical protein